MYRPYRRFVQAQRLPGPHVGPTCPTCQHIHDAAVAVAVGRFTPGGPQGYRSRMGGPVRSTRSEAVADACKAFAATPEG